MFLQVSAKFGEVNEDSINGGRLLRMLTIAFNYWDEFSFDQEISSAFEIQGFSELLQNSLGFIALFMSKTVSTAIVQPFPDLN